MGALLALAIIATISFIAVRVGATALMMTGLSWDTASFQSYSAFFGVGFTTREAEMVVQHPIRRRIIRDLIFAGNVGLTSALATLVVTFVQQDTTLETLETAGWIVGGLIAFIAIFNLPIVKRCIDWGVRRSLKNAKVLHTLDYDLLLHVQHGFCVSEIDVTAECPFTDTTLGELRPADDGVIVLGITRKGGSFVGAPGPEDRIEKGDVLTVYGQDESIRKFMCPDLEKEA